MLNLPEYLAQSRIVSEEHTRLLRDTLDHFHDGFLFFLLLWRSIKTPTCSGGRHDDELLKTYQIVDRDIGMVLDRAGSATLNVMSDHGLAAFDYAVNLNTWLYQEGFLALNRQGWRRGGDETLASIDWKRTKAYAMGLNALYIDLAGRKNENGIVMPGAERDALMAELSRRLRKFIDPDTAQCPWWRMLPRSGNEPAVLRRVISLWDIRQVIALRGRRHWAVSLTGAGPREQRRTWIADHCISAAAVPGVLLGTASSVLLRTLTGSKI